MHQNHDYSYHPNGRAGVWYGTEADENFKLAGNGRHRRRISDATEVLHAAGIRSNARRRQWSAARSRRQRRGKDFAYCELLQPIAFFFYGITRPIRHALGLPKRSAATPAISAECAATRRTPAFSTMSSQKPLISVLIDTFNYGQYVEEAIESAHRAGLPCRRARDPGCG